MQSSILNWILSALPIFTILLLMLGFKWGGFKSGALSWMLTILISVIFFGAGFPLIIAAQIKGFFLALDVLLVIWSALFFYLITDKAGTIKVIGMTLAHITRDITLQALFIGWLFTSLLQGLGGFGVPVAVAAPMLVVLGFSSIQAVVMSSIGAGWAVTFGSMAIAFQSLLAVTNLPANGLIPAISFLLGISAIFCGLLVAYLANGFFGIRKNLVFIVLIGLVLGFSQYLLAMNGIWIVAVSGASLLGLAAAYILLKFVPIHKIQLPIEKVNRRVIQKENDPGLLHSLLPYLVLFILTLIINLIPLLKNLLDMYKIGLSFPDISTSFGWLTPAENTRSISIFGHAGMIIFYVSLFCFVLFRKYGYLEKKAISSLFKETFKSALQPSLAILAMVGIASMMNHAGMIHILATGLSQVFDQKLYPLISPFIGALGAFITGSNSNSNVLFGQLQMQTAQLLKLSVPVILAAQTAGGALGSIISPAKVIVGCSTVGLNGKEGQVLGKLLLYGSIPIFLVAFFTYVILR